MPSTFPVIDLFAGPGGLGEGFSAFTAGAGGAHGFDVRLSIEMDAVAHQTLLLRKFFRAFDEPPDHYYAYIAGTLTRDELFARYPEQHRLAGRCAWQAELGRRNQGTVTKRINIALGEAERWALIGGPPCQAYSLVGRSRMQSRTNPEFEKDHRHFLYREYLRIVARHCPPVFLMENVKGLLSATHGGENIFPRILSDLHQPGRALRMRGRTRLTYRLFPLVEPAQRSLIDTAEIIEDPESLVVRAEQFGIPQARHRVFVLGIREDIRATPGHLQTSGSVHVSDVVADLPRIRSTLSREDDSPRPGAPQLPRCATSPGSRHRSIPISEQLRARHARRSTRSHRPHSAPVTPGCRTPAGLQNSPPGTVRTPAVSVTTRPADT